MATRENLVWDIKEIFSYDHYYQEHCGDGVIYYDCILLIDFGPFKKGHACNIYIDSCSHGDFVMQVGCDGMGYGGKRFVPVWTYVEDVEENDDS